MATNTQPKSPTLQLGAQKERDSWLAKLRRDLRRGGHNAGDYIESLVAWGLARKTRFNARPGKLGK